MIEKLQNGEYTLQNKSFAFYEAKKKQFFMTFDVISTSKTISGDLSKKDGICKGSIKIDARDFDSKNKIRDSHVKNDYLNTNKHPFITYSFEIVDNTTKGVISVNGVEKEISFPLNISVQEDIVSLDGKIEVKYSDFGIKTPANFILSAFDELNIGAKLFLKRI